MSHRELQQALVIAQHDPGFLDDPRDVTLTAEERAQLAGVDRRAFATDPLRRRRVLKALVEELKASTTLFCRERGEIAALEGFFASRWFRRAVVERTPLAPALGEFLGEGGSPALTAIARLETALCRARRAKGPPPPPGHVALAPGVSLLAFDFDVVAAVQALERWLFAATLVPQQVLCADLPPFPSTAIGSARELVVTPPGNVADVDPDLFRVLDAFRAPLPLTALADRLSPLGVRSPQTTRLVESLAQDGLVIVAVTK
jgi:hypothetical protein